MSFTFERPVGAAMDVRELEYITALHQTKHNDEGQYRDGSIDATDIKHYLMSRYGIQISKQDAQNLIMHDLAGSNSSQESLDIPEIVAILLIPYLRKISTLDLTNHQDVPKEFVGISKFEKEAMERKKMLRNMHDFDSTIIEKVLNMILIEATGSSKPQRLTKDLLCKVFEHYGEKELANDDQLLQEMIEMAVGQDNAATDSTILDAKAFQRALTVDLECYNHELEQKFTTHYEDVFGLVTVENEKMTKDEEENAESMESGNSNIMHTARNEISSQGQVIKRVFAFPQIDYLADSFRDKSQYVMVWLAVIFAYISYFDPFNSYGIQVCNEEDQEKFHCKVALSIVLWFTILAIMLAFMAPSVLILSLGNNIHRHNPIEIFGGIVGIAALIFFPALYTGIDNRVLSTATIEDAPWLSTLFKCINLSIGSILLFFQICNIVRWVVPDSELRESKFLTLVLRGSGVRSEFGIKQAAMKKVHGLVRNAYRLCSSIDNVDAKHSVSLLNYMKLAEKRETCGGFFWAWKLFLNGSVIDEEGIWVHTRLLAGNIAQLICLFAITIFALVLSSQIIDDVYSPEPVPQNNRCGSFVNPELCYFPTYTDGSGRDRSIGLGLCQNVRLTNTTCLDEFVTVPETIQAQVCDTLTDINVMPNFNEYLDADGVLQYLNTDREVCPELVMPYPSTILTAFEGSNDDHFCVSPILVCTPTGLNSDGENQGNCIIGQDRAWPFTFRGDGCANYTTFNEDFAILYADKLEYEGKINDTTPKKSAVQASVGIGVMFTFLSGLSTVLVNIPSQIVTTMKFRTGAIETLRDRQFLKQRDAMLNVTYLLGASVWGLLMMSLGVFVLVTAVAFVLLYHVTRPFALDILAALIGVVMTLLVKTLVSLLLNRYNFVGFYRKRPVLANIVNVGFECWHLAVTSGFIVMRAVKLVIVVVFNLGRLDRPILASGVGEMGPLALDNFPSIFAKDLLATDAHRHPYIERLGMMYLMKLKHGDNFARRAGSIWRLLFVFALMPYFRKNRIAAIKAEVLLK